MKIVSLLLQIRPEQIDSVSASLAGIPGVSLHGLTPDAARLVVMIEDGAGYAVTDSIIAVSVTPGVLGTTLAYEYSDEDVAPEEIAAAFAKSRRQEIRA